MNEITAHRQESLAKQAVLFPPNAPAGLDLSTLRAKTQIFPWAKPKEQKDRVGGELRDLAARLFEEAVGEGLRAADAADVVVHSSAYIATREEYVAWCHASGISRPDHVVAKRAYPRELWAVSGSIARLIELAVVTENVTVATTRHLQTLPSLVRSSLTEEERARDPFWFLADPLLPDGVVGGMFASHRAFAMAAAFDGFVSRGRFSLPLMKMTATIWLGDARRYLVLLASIPNSNVPENVVAPSERFDLERAIKSQADLLAVLNEVT